MILFPTLVESHCEPLTLCSLNNHWIIKFKHINWHYFYSWYWNQIIVYIIKYSNTLKCYEAFSFFVTLSSQYSTLCLLCKFFFTIYNPIFIPIFWSLGHSFSFLSMWPAAAAARSLQSCPTLCDPIDGSPPGSPVPGILQARTLEWVAISFSIHVAWTSSKSPSQN